mmetsp:Transcript_7486/g.16559  ORF Transcript_7486/g.16559 Transcript_7486/m.16559 type:complete len:275 (+) Transcript_7486:117-941(+)
MSSTLEPPFPTYTHIIIIIMAHLHFGLDNFFQTDNILGKVSNTVGQLFRGHWVLIHHPAKCFFVHVNLFNLHEGRLAGFQLFGNGNLRSREFVQQFGRNGQSVAAAQFRDLILITERGSHDNGVVSVLFVVVVDLSDTNDAGVLLGLESVNALGLFVIIKDASDKGADQGNSAISTGNSLGKTKNQSEVAGNAFLFQHFGGFDAFPCGSNLDQNGRLVHANFLVQFNDFASLGNRGLRVKRKASVNLRRNVTGNQLVNLGTKGDGQFILCNSSQ